MNSQAAIAVSSRIPDLTFETNRDTLTRIRLAPNWHGLIALQHHAVTNHIGQRQSVRSPCNLWPNFLRRRLRQHGDRAHEDHKRQPEQSPFANLQLVSSMDYCVVYPPSTIKCVPVMNDASSEARNKIGYATSRGSPTRLSRCLGASVAIKY